VADTAVLTSLITGGTGVLSGLIGYGTARGQRTIELRRLAGEERESEHTRRDRALEARRALYLDYMEAYDHFMGLYNEFDVTPQQVSERIAALRKRVNAVRLLGSQRVRLAVEDLYSIYNEQFEKADRNADDLNSELRQRVFDPEQVAWTHAYDRLLDAMRRDVGDFTGGAT
jgi:hypothetical protein